MAGFARTIRGLVFRATDRYVITNPPRGARLGYDLARSVPTWHAHTVLDVGANLGQSTAAFLTEFAAQRVIAFEPVADTFLRLKTRFTGDNRVTCVATALGAATGTATIHVRGDGGDRSTLTPDCIQGGGAGEDVAITTLDAWCGANGVVQADVLKIDVEGAEREVLAGAAGLLSVGALGLIHIEAGLLPGGDHVPLAEICAILGAHGYRVFGLYDQTPEWTTGDVYLRRINAVFVSPTLAAAARR